MKLRFILILIIFTAAWSSCKKCQTCVPHFYSHGVIGGVDTFTQSIKLCDKRDIAAYESLTSFRDGNSAGEDTVRFICN